MYNIQVPCVVSDCTMALSEVVATMGARRAYRVPQMHVCSASRLAYKLVSSCEPVHGPT